MSATATKQAKKPAAKTAAKPATKAAKTAPAVAAEILADGTPVVFTELRTPVEGELQIEAGVVVYISSHNEDDGSYNISKTPNGLGVETLYREEFRLATPEESAKGAEVAKVTKAAKVKQITDAEADSGTKTKKTKDKAGKTVKVKAVKPAKVAKVKKVKPEPEPIGPVKLLTGVKAIITESGGLIEAAEILSDRSGRTEFSLGGVLAKIQETNAFEDIKGADGQPKYGTGHVGFGKFVEMHLGMKYRKAIYLSGNYTKITNLGITEKQILGIPWSKLVLVVSAITEGNADELLAEAKAKPYAEFKDSVKKRLVDGGGSLHGNTKASLVTFTFKLHNDKGDVAVAALTKAREELGLDEKDPTANSQAFDHIVSEWMSMKD